MASKKQKRRKRQAREWAQFQQEHNLSDEDVQLARQTGYPLKLLQEKSSDPSFADDVPLGQRIHEIHRRWQEELAAKNAAIESGLIERPAKKKKMREVAHDPAWAQAKKLCGLNMEDIRKAKELGFSPRKLVKNIPSPTQPWKAPVKIWIRDMYEKQAHRAAQKKAHREPQAASANDA